MKSCFRVLFLVVLAALPILYCNSIAIETYREIEGINRVTFAIMDLQVRTFHYAAGHKGKVVGCRECQQDIHDYLKGLERRYPEAFLD